jgi:hypothetical protein
MAICPICRMETQELELATFDGRRFSCKRHGQFDVVNMALSIPEYREANTEVWEAALYKAKSRAKPGERPRISPYDFASASHLQ